MTTATIETPTITATYDPADNKIRIRSSERFDGDTYARLKAAGFVWAPKQELFVAPMWTPAREDLATELAGEIEDEDTTLVDRAAERAERLNALSERRVGEAERAHEYVGELTGGSGSLVVGHHSHAKAEKQAKKIEKAADRAVKLWEDSKYWAARAKGALRNAAYKERADVRHRRIKGLEADLRKQEKALKEAQTFLDMWQAPDKELTLKRAIAIANYDHVSKCFPLAQYPRELPASQYEGSMSIWSALDGGIITPEQARDIAVAKHHSNAGWHIRWAQHYAFRIEYEKAMLGEDGGIAADKFDLAIGGTALIGQDWVTITRLNKKGDKVVSVTTNARYVPVRGVEEIKDYKAPEAGVAEKVKAVNKAAPLCNFKQDGCQELTAEEYKQKSKFTDAYRVRSFAATETTGAYRHRIYYSMSSYKKVPVFITDAKVTMPPAVTEAKPTLPVETDLPTVLARPKYQAPEPTKFDALKEQMKGGVVVVSAPQLFPTPTELAERMVAIADIQPGDRVLEPSAGTGRLLGAMGGRMFDHNPECGSVTAIEINQKLADKLAVDFPLTEVMCADFLLCAGAHPKYNKILMNPPFANGADVEHVTTALKCLADGGTLVAIMSSGATFRDDRKTREFRSLIEDLGGEFEELPANTFASSGTGVNTVLLTVRK